MVILVLLLAWIYVLFTAKLAQSSSGLTKGSLSPDFALAPDGSFVA